MNATAAHKAAMFIGRTSALSATGSALLAAITIAWLAAGLPDYRWPGEDADLEHIFGNISSIVIVSGYAALAAAIVLGVCSLIGWLSRRQLTTLPQRSGHVWPACIASAYLLSVVAVALIS